MDSNEDLENCILRITFVFIIVGLFLGGCSYINNRFSLKDDHAVEELIEQIIEKKTGLDIDLTPNSKE